ncbi:MAG: AAA family ATPase [Pirellulales bacterium]
MITPVAELLRTMADLKGVPDLLEQLQQPGFFGDHDPLTEVIETHISWVFLTSRFAYKLKKPVRFGFLDFSTPDRRHRACVAELQVNRRLAPTTYLQVVPLTVVPSSAVGADIRLMHSSVGPAVELDGRGPAIDWVVKMQRLPADRSLDYLLTHQGLTEAQSHRLVRFLGDFYARQAPLSLNADRFLAQIRAHIDQNRTDLETHLPEWQDTTLRVHAAQRLFTALAADVLARRVIDGRIIDGHGDLRPEHIYLMSPPVVIDCIEFDAGLRQNDIADELSFLAMECEQLNAGELGERILSGYQQRSGDVIAHEVIAFFKSYRACVRAKVCALRCRQELEPRPASPSSPAPPTPYRGPDPALARRQAERYLETARDLIRQFSPQVIVAITGLMGSGKTTLATAVAERLDCSRFGTDDVRHELHAAAAHPTTYGADGYAMDQRLRIYDAVAGRATAALDRHVCVVVDGTYNTHAMQETLCAASRATGSEVLLVRCDCPPEIARNRVTRRLQLGNSNSAAQPEWLERQAHEYEPSQFAHQLTVDATASIEDQVHAVFAALSQLWSVHRHVPT